MKIIAFYLPQFHNIPENDEWWGDGFTEWTNVKKAKPLYEGHMQPRVPLGGNYYNLLDDNVKIWQADLAKKYGVYGFCYYHYWFNGKMLLEKPMEQMLANKEVDIPFCICWANEPWTKAWVGDERKLLIAQEYGQEEEWKQHFMYLLPFFKDERYITKNGKPLFVFYRPDIVPCMKEMIETWDKLAKENGLSGITFAFQSGDYDWNNSKEAKLFDYDIEFQPPYDCGFTSTMEMIDVNCKSHLPDYIPTRMFDFFVEMGTSVWGHFCISKADACKAVSQTDIPILIIHGDRDTQAPLSMAYRLYDSCSSEKQLYVVHGANHAENYRKDPEGYENVIAQFVEEHSGALKKEY